MKKYKYLILFAILIAVVVALRFSSIIGKPNVGAGIIEEILDLNPAGEIEEVLTGFDSLYKANILESGAVGGAVVITYKGRVAMLKCFGERKTGENEPVNEHTVFRLASVSKAVTGVLAGILADEGKINLDARVIDFLPEFRLKIPESTNSITIRNLLSHTSGLTPHAFDTMVEDKVPLEQITKRLNEVEIVAPPGLVYAYQNVMFSLFDPVLETITKQNFQETVKNEIFKPFGMKDASSDFESFQNNDNKAFPHQKRENGFAPIKLNDRYYTTLPAAGINASISDLGQFLIAISEKHNSRFTDKARELVFTPQVETPLRSTYYRNWDKIESKHYAIGWRIINYKERTISHHGGFVAGYQSEIAVCHNEEVGIAVLSNSPNSYFSSIVPAFFNQFFEFKNKQNAETDALANQQISTP